MPTHDWKLVIHGGAGVIERDSLGREEEQDIRAALQHALDTGASILANGGSALGRRHCDEEPRHPRSRRDGA
jgi:isoaspartyl peptidase/L-asparaginase-like protein (Ntn-hydrolase superfamily)